LDAGDEGRYSRGNGNRAVDNTAREDRHLSQPGIAAMALVHNTHDHGKRVNPRLSVVENAL
jgi:hypothetical protein